MAGGASFLLNLLDAWRNGMIPPRYLTCRFFAFDSAFAGAAPVNKFTRRKEPTTSSNQPEGWKSRITDQPDEPLVLICACGAAQRSHWSPQNLGQIGSPYGLGVVRESQLPVCDRDSQT